MWRVLLFFRLVSRTRSAWADRAVLGAVAGLPPGKAECGRWCGEKKVDEVIPLAVALATGQVAPSCLCSPRMAAAGHSWGQTVTWQSRGWSAT